MNDNKKRYVLFSKDDGRSDAEKPCAFFASPAGCKNGSNCKFLHGVKQNLNFHQSLNNNNVNNNLSSNYNMIDRSNDNASIAIDNSNNTNVKMKSKDKKIKNTDNQYDLKATTLHSSSSFPTFSNNNNNYNNNHTFQPNSSQLHVSSQLQQSHTTVAAVSSNSNDLIIQQLRDQLAQQQQLLNTHVLTNTNANNQAFNYSQAVDTTYKNNQVTTHTPGSSADTNYSITQQSSSSSNTKKKQEKKRKSSDGNEINDNSSPLNTSNKKKSSNDTSSSSIPVSTNNHMDLPYHSNPYSSIIASTQVIAGNSMSTLTQHHQQPQPPSLASITNYETNDDYDEDEDEDNNQFLLSVVNHVLDSSAQKAPFLSTQFQQQQLQPNQQQQQHHQQSLQLQQKQQMQEQPQQHYVMSHLPPPISNQHQIIAPTVIEMKQQQPLIQTKNTYTTVPTTTTTAVSSSSIVATNPFINSQDALKALQSSGSTHALYNVSKKNIFATPKTSSSNTSTNNTMINNSSINNDVKIPKNIFNPALVNFHELPWMKLVEQTKLNFRYPSNYTYVEDSSWVKAKIYGPWCINNNNIKNIISLDCEMCETTDPVTNNKYDNTLIRISVFDIDHKVLIDSLVQPGLPITETRTNIHGITEKQLAVAPWTLRQAQAALLNICSDQTIIIGHSIHKDLKSLKFNHKNVIDTAYLYTVDNEPGAAPSLRDISEQILGIKLPETHNSIQDAQAALYAAATLLAYGPQPSISRKSSSLSLTKEFSLLIHRIPDYCNEEQLHHMIIDYTYIVPIKVNTIIRSDSGSDNKNNSDYQKKGDIPSGKTIITFSTQQHRDLAFESIVGPNRPDKQNRPQKRIYFKGGGYICIRR